MAEKTRQAEREENAAKAKEERERQELAAKERQAERDAQAEKARLEKEAAVAAKEEAKLAAQKAKDDAKAAKRTSKERTATTESDVDTTKNTPDTQGANTPKTSPEERSIQDVKIIAASPKEATSTTDTSAQATLMAEGAQSSNAQPDVTATGESTENRYTGSGSSRQSASHTDAPAAEHDHDAVAHPDKSTNEVPYHDASIDVVPRVLSPGELVADPGVSYLKPDFTTPEKYIDVLLAPLLPADRHLVKEWLDTLEIDVLEKLSQLDITKANLVLNNRKMVDDEEARNAYVVDLEALQKEIRERPSIEVVFKKTEYTVAEDTEEEVEQTYDVEEVVAGTLRKSARQVRKEEKARKSLAKEEARLAATKESIEKDKEDAIADENKANPVKTTRFVEDVTEEYKPSLLGRFKEKRIIKAATKETVKSLKKEEALATRAAKRADKLAESFNSTQVPEISESPKATRKSKRYNEDAPEDQAVQAEESAPTPTGTILDEIIIDKDIKKLTKVNDKKEVKFRKKQQAEDRAEAVKLEKLREREKEQENSMRVSQEKELIAEQAADTRDQVKEVKRLEKDRKKSEANEAKERDSQAKQDAAAAKESSKRRRKQETIESAERKAQEARDKVLNRESDKISKRASKINKTAGENELIPIGGPQSSYGWGAESGGRETVAYSSDIDPLDFDIPEGLPVRNR